MWTQYFSPTSLDAALEMLAEQVQFSQRNGTALPRLIAGGTDIMIEFERGVRKACAIIDISRLQDLNRITLESNSLGNDVIHLGPLVTHNEVIVSALCVERATPLALACREVGAPQIRNRATVAGNLITASPANDTITALIALDAQVTLRSVRGSRVVPLAEFYLGVRKTVMQPDEMLIDIAMPALKPNQHGIYLKLGLRRAQAISVVNCAVVIEQAPTGLIAADDGNTSATPAITDIRIALGAVAPKIIRAEAAERSLVGNPLSEFTITRAAHFAQSAATPISDVRSSATYRQDMVGVLVERALRRLETGRVLAEWASPAVLVAGLQVADASAANSDAATATVNGMAYTIPADAHDKSVLRWLREDCGLIGTKEGCAEGECGACTVLMDGKAVMSCLVPAPRAAGAALTTIEGVGDDEKLHPLQQAFIDCAAVQCGYCTPGFIMSGAALFVENGNPSDGQIKEAISGNLCRCTGYYKILEAFDQTRRAMQPQQ
ncbi:MAG: FAD binding domain-containing protein [Anaerolineae bacterium]|nr:FAD binding domain-containing protein [Anaerolineae bacterium]